MERRLLTFLIIFVGGGIGSMLRHYVNVATAAVLGVHFPFGTFTVNIAGSFVMGFAAGLFTWHNNTTQNLKTFWTTGVIGGFTTFSTFSLDTVLLVERGQRIIAAVYIAFSVGGAIAGIFAGMALARRLFA